MATPSLSFVGSSTWELKSMPALSFMDQPVRRLGSDDILLGKLLSGSGGETYLIHFWASWCAPCVEEIPELLSVYSSTAVHSAGHDFPRLVLVAVSDKPANVSAFLSTLDAPKNDREWFRRHRIAIVLDPRFSLLHFFMNHDPSGTGATVPTSILYKPASSQGLVHAGPYDWSAGIPLFNGFDLTPAKTTMPINSDPDQPLLSLMSLYGAGERRHAYAQHIRRRLAGTWRAGLLD